MCNKLERTLVDAIRTHVEIQLSLQFEFPSQGLPVVPVASGHHHLHVTQLTGNSQSVCHQKDPKCDCNDKLKPAEQANVKAKVANTKLQWQREGKQGYNLEVPWMFLKKIQPAKGQVPASQGDSNISQHFLHV